MPQPGRLQWDQDRIAVCLQTGKGREDFLAALEAAFVARQDALEELRGRPTPDANWDLIVSIVQQVAAKFFLRGKGEEYRRDRTLLKDLLRRRALWRQKASDFDAHFPSIAAAINTISKQLRTLRRREAKEFREARAADCALAWKTRNQKSAHHTSTLLAGTGIRLRKRFCNAVPAARPSLSELSAVATADACDGGLASFPVDFAEMRNAALAQGGPRKPPPPLPEEEKFSVPSYDHLGRISSSRTFGIPADHPATSLYNRLWSDGGPEFQSALHDYEAERSGTWVDFLELHSVKAGKLVKDTAARLAKAARRRAAVGWSAPAEVWLMALWPSWRPRMRASAWLLNKAETFEHPNPELQRHYGLRPGLGRRDSFAAPSVKAAITGCVAQCVGTQSIPLAASQSQVWHIDKRNQLPGVQGLRWIHGMCVFWRSFFRGAFLDADPAPLPPYHAGSAPHQPYCPSLLFAGPPAIPSTRMPRRDGRIALPGPRRRGLWRLGFGPAPTWMWMR